MPRPKAIAVAYDPDIDDARRYNNAVAVDAVTGIAGVQTLPNAWVTRGLETASLALWMGAQLGTGVIYTATLALSSHYTYSARFARSQLRAAFTLVPSVAGELALISLIAGVIVLLTTLREGYYAQRSPWTAYLPGAGALVSLGLLLTANRVQFNAYTSGYGDLASLLHTLQLLSYAQVVVLCAVAFALAWLQNTVARQKQSAA